MTERIMEKVNTRRVLLALLLAIAAIAVVGVALAAELLSVEVVAGTENAIIQVEQGQTVSFTIKLSAASGKLGSSYTPSNPAKASIPTKYAIAADGSKSTADPTAEYAFWHNSVEDPASQYRDPRWTGWPTPYSVDAQASANINTPLGEYTFEIVPTIVGTDAPKLVNDTHDYLIIRVVAATAQDTTPPVITITTPVDGAVYLLHQVVLADWTATDSESGIATAVGTVASGAPIDTTTVGSHTFTVTATDNAGNSATQSVTYYVHYGFNGLLAPYAPPEVRAYKINSSIPLKWQYADCDGVVQNSAAAYPKVDIYEGEQTDYATGEVVEVHDPGVSGLQYDALTDTWQYNWQTKGLTPGKYTIWITTTDASDQTNGPFYLQLR